MNTSTRRTAKRFIALSLLLSFLVACSSPSPSITPEPTDTPAPAATLEPALTLTPSPIAPTPTETPEPTRTPTPTPGPSFGEKLELIGQMGGESFAVAVQGSYAFLGVGPRLAVLDVSHSTAPTLVGQTELLPGVVSGLAVAGDYAYVTAGDAGLRVVDVSDPLNPTEVGSHDTPGDAMGVAVAGRYAYVAAFGAGLRVVDVSDPSNPTEVGSYDTPGYAKDIAVVGGYAYVADSDAGLRVVNVSNPTNPTEVGFHQTPGAAWGIDIAGDYAYVAASGAGLRVMDISAPTNPREIGSCEMPGDATSVAVTADNRFSYPFAYVAVRYTHIVGGLGSLREVDIAVPSNPREVGFYYATPGDAMDVVVAANNAYVAAAGAGLRVVSVYWPGKPTEVGFYDTPGWPEDVAVATGDSQDDHTYAYVADGGLGLRVVDISDPHSPMDISLYDTPGYASGVAVAAGDSKGHTYAYVADLGAGLRVMDVSDPGSPTEVSSYDMPERAWGVAVDGDYAYVAAKDAGLRVMDISTPISPTEVGFYDTPGDAYGVAVASDSQGHTYAYVAASDAGLRILDISTPISPTEVGFYDTPGDVRGVAVATDDPQGHTYAYISERDVGLRVVNVSDPANPTEVSSYDTPGWTAGIAVAGGYVYVADGPNGLVVLRHAARSATGVIPGPATSMGQIAFVSDRDGDLEIYSMNADGNELINLTNNPAADWGPVWSPDGQQLAFVSNRSGVRAIHVINADRTGARQLTNLPAGSYGPVWSPDGSRIAFASQIGQLERLEIYWMNSDGSGLTKVFSQPGYGGRITWSPDGKRLLFDATAGGGFDLWIVNLDGSGLQTMASSESWDYTPAWSPDGQHIAFGSNRAGGRQDIWVANQSGSGAQNVTGPIGSPFGPVWSPDSRWIALMSGGYGFYIVRPDGSQLTKLSDLRFTGVGAQWSWSPDSAQIAFVAPAEDNRDIYIVSADGSGLTNLTDHPARDSNPAWRPTPSSISEPVESEESREDEIAYVGEEWIAFVGLDRNIWLVYPDGTGLRQITTDAVVEYRERPKIEYSDPKWSPTGERLAFARYDRDSTIHSLMMFEIGASELTALTLDTAGGFDWGPVGNRIAYDKPASTAIVSYPFWDWEDYDGLWVFDLLSGQDTLAVPPQSNQPLLNPDWSPDGRYVAFEDVAPFIEGPWSTFAVVEMGSGAPYTIWDSALMFYACDWSPDSAQLACVDIPYISVGPCPLLTFDRSGAAIAELPTDDDSCDLSPLWSPDGQYIAVHAWVGDWDAPLETFADIITPDGSERRRIATGEPLAWSPDGRLLLIVDEGTISVAEIDTGATMVIGVGSDADWQPQPMSPPSFDDLAATNQAVIPQLEQTYYEHIYGSAQVPINAYSEGAAIDLLAELGQTEPTPEQLAALSRLVLQEKALAQTLQDYSILSNDLADTEVDIVAMEWGVLFLFARAGFGPGSSLYDLADRTMWDLTKVGLGQIADEETRDLMRNGISLVSDAISSLEDDPEAIVIAIHAEHTRAEVAGENIAVLVSHVQPTIDQGVQSVAASGGETWAVEGDYTMASLQLDYITNVSQIRRETAHSQYQQLAERLATNEVLKDITDLVSVGTGSIPPAKLFDIWPRAQKHFVDTWAQVIVGDSMACIRQVSERAGELAFQPQQQTASCEDQTDSSFARWMDGAAWLNLQPRLENDLASCADAVQTVQEAVRDGDLTQVQEAIDQLAAAQSNLNTSSMAALALLTPPAGEAWSPETGTIAQQIVNLELDMLGLQIGLAGYLADPDSQEAQDYVNLYAQRLLEGALESQSLDSWQVFLPLIARATGSAETATASKPSVRISDAASLLENVTWFGQMLESEAFESNAVPVPLIAYTPVELEGIVGQQVTIEMHVQNAGSATLTEATLTASTRDTVLDSLNVPSIDAGGSAELTLSFTLSAEGQSVLLLELDDGIRTDFRLIPLTVRAAPQPTPPQLTPTAADETGELQEEQPEGVSAGRSPVILLVMVVAAALTAVLSVVALRQMRSGRTCTKCGFDDNPPKTAHCVECGAPLPRRSRAVLIGWGVSALVLVAIIILWQTGLLGEGVESSTAPSPMPELTTPTGETIAATVSSPIHTPTPSSISGQSPIATPAPEANTPTPTAEIPSSCPGAPKQQVRVGDRARVCTAYERLAVRTQPRTDSTEATRLEPGTYVTIVDGPTCAESWSWWKVQTDLGTAGWVTEGGDDVDPYFICPVR